VRAPSINAFSARPEFANERCHPEEDVLPIELELLKTERDKLKDSLRETEADLRKMEADVKLLRQREIQTKREIEALSTLIELKEGRDKP
jgi:hypothetical protein